MEAAQRNLRCVAHFKNVLQSPVSPTESGDRHHGTVAAGLRGKGAAGGL